MMRNLIIGFLVLINNSAYSQSAYTPIKGSPERKEILDCLRPGTDNTVIFKVEHFLINNDWACVMAVPRYYHEEGSSKYDEGEYMWGLFKKSSGKWKMIDWSQGVEIRDDFELIDVPIQNSRVAKLIVKKYPGCPMAIFPKH